MYLIFAFLCNAEHFFQARLSFIHFILLTPSWIPGTWYYMFNEKLTDIMHIDGIFSMNICFSPKQKVNHWPSWQTFVYSKFSKMIWDWMEICFFRDHCHSWMCLWTLLGKSSSCWSQLRSTSTGVWCWRTTATWCSRVGNASLKGVCVISRLSLLCSWKLGHFCKILDDLELIFGGQIFLFSLWHQNMLVEWCLLCQMQKGSLIMLPLNNSVPVLLNPWVPGNLGPGCLWFSIHRVSTHQTQYHFPVGTRRAMDDANPESGPSRWVTRTFRSFPPSSELLRVLMWCFLCVCVFVLFVTIFSSCSLCWHSQLPSYLPVVVDSFHSAFKQLFLFTWLDVTFTHLRLSFSFLKLLIFIFNSHRSSFLLLETCLLGDSAPLFLLACHSVISVLSEVIPASFDDTSYLTWSLSPSPYSGDTPLNNLSHCMTECLFSLCFTDLTCSSLWAQRGLFYIPYFCHMLEVLEDSHPEDLSSFFPCLWLTVLVSLHLPFGTGFNWFTGCLPCMGHSIV